MMTVIDLVARNARMYPDGIAFVEVRPVSNRRTDITWRAFNERMNRIARVLSAKGVKKGMKVALMGRNSIAWLEVFFGIMATGAWAIPLNFRFTDEDIKYCADIAEPAVFLFDEEYAGRIVAMKAALPMVTSYISLGSGADGLEALMKGAGAEALGIEAFGMTTNAPSILRPARRARPRPCSTPTALSWSPPSRNRPTTNGPTATATS